MLYINSAQQTIQFLLTKKKYSCDNHARVCTHTHTNQQITNWRHKLHKPVFFYSPENLENSNYDHN